ncbi:MAG: hypothetical protein KF778_10020 [Rhodocyclaceae bacterium]|nr:hypothetical protein [Rhodocyclaceae bacterium]MBX3668725.1 hypothetical protein [Rhodocyclaceae bacterium]
MRALDLSHWRHFCLAAIVFAATSFSACAQNVVAIVAASTPQGTLTRNALRTAFSMRLNKWPDGNRMTVYVLPDYDPIHAAFCKEVLDVYPHQLRLVWDRLVFSGTGQAPREVESEDEMIAKIAVTPGAIGYVKRNKLDERVRSLELY